MNRKDYKVTLFVFSWVDPEKGTGLFFFGLLGQIEEVGQLGYDDAVGRAREVVFLGALVEIGEGVIVTAFEQEVACLGAQLQTGTACDAVVELVLYGFGMLFYRDAGVVGPVAALGVAVADEESYLRTGMDEELQAAVFTERQVSQEGNLDVVHLPGVLQFGEIFVVFVPSALGEVDFQLGTANHLEVFLADVAGSDAAVDALEVLLPHRGREADGADVDTSVYADGKVVALFAYLRLQGKGGRCQQSGAQ